MKNQTNSKNEIKNAIYLIVNNVDTVPGDKDMPRKITKIETDKDLLDFIDTYKDLPNQPSRCRWSVEFKLGKETWEVFAKTKKQSNKFLESLAGKCSAKMFTKVFLSKAGYQTSLSKCRPVEPGTQKFSRDLRCA